MLLGFMKHYFGDVGEISQIERFYTNHTRESDIYLDV